MYVTVNAAAAATVAGFKLDTLLKLADVKGTDRKTSLLHFVLDQLLKDSPGMRSLPHQLANVKAAANLQVGIIVHLALYSHRRCRTFWLDSTASLLYSTEGKIALQHTRMRCSLAQLTGFKPHSYLLSKSLPLC